MEICIQRYAGHGIHAKGSTIVESQFSPFTVGSVNQTLVIRFTGQILLLLTHFSASVSIFNF